MPQTAPLQAAAQVSAALLAHAPTTCPQDVKQLLAVALPHAFQSKEAGHLQPYQLKLMDAVSALFEDQGEILQRAQHDTKTQMQDIEAKLGELETSANSASDLESVVKDDIEQKKGAVRAAEEESAEIEGEHSDAVKAHEEVNVEWQDKSRQGNEVKRLVEKMEALLSGTWNDDQERKTFVNDLVGFLEAQDAERVLIAAAVPALGAKPGDRVEFDNIICEGVNAAVQAQHDDVEKVLAEALLREENADAIALGMWALRDATKDQEQLAKQELEAASDNLRNATRDRLDAMGQMEKQRVEMRACVAKLTEQQGQANEVNDAIAAVARIKCPSSDLEELLPKRRKIEKAPSEEAEAAEMRAPAAGA